MRLDCQAKTSRKKRAERPISWLASSQNTTDFFLHRSPFGVHDWLILTQFGHNENRKPSRKTASAFGCGTRYRIPRRGAAALR